MKKTFDILLKVTFLLVLSVVISFFFDGMHLFSSFQHFIKVSYYGFVLGGSFWLCNELLGNTIVRRLNWRSQAKKSVRLSLMLYIISGILISLIIPYIHFKYVLNIPTNQLPTIVLFNSFIGLTIDLVIISIYFSEYLTSSIIDGTKHIENLKQENLQAKYEALKNQVNPHFLFNSLNTLSGLVEQQPDKSTEYIKKLSDIYRFVLDQKEKELIPFADELKFVEDYVFLQKMRYGNGLVFVESVADKEFLVAPLCIQMLIENALKHNIITEDMPLTIQLKDDGKFVVVSNNLQKKNFLTQSTCVGLENLKNRYQFFAQKEIDILETKENFIVTIPKLFT